MEIVSMKWMKRCGTIPLAALFACGIMAANANAQVTVKSGALKQSHSFTMEGTTAMTPTVLGAWETLATFEIARLPKKPKKKILQVVLSGACSVDQTPQVDTSPDVKVRVRITKTRIKDGATVEWLLLPNEIVLCRDVAGDDLTTPTVAAAAQFVTEKAFPPFEDKYPRGRKFTVIVEYRIDSADTTAFLRNYQIVTNVMRFVRQ